MPQILGTSAALGFFAVVQSLGMLFFAYWCLKHGAFGIHLRGHVQTVVFLQLVNGGHMMILVTRARRWFFQPPFPAPPLLTAIVGTQVLAVLMSAFGWLVPAISWPMIGVVLAYNVVWVFVMSGVRIVTEQLVTQTTNAHRKYRSIVNQDVRMGSLGVH